MGKSEYDPVQADRRAWNSGRKVGAKRALKPRQVWAIRLRLLKARKSDCPGSPPSARSRTGLHPYRSFSGSHRVAPKRPSVQFGTSLPGSASPSQPDLA